MEQAADRLIEEVGELAPQARVVKVANKLDLLGADGAGETDMLWVSALTGTGLEDLRQAIVDAVGYRDDSQFTARARHVRNLEAALAGVREASNLLSAGGAPMPELVAEALRRAHDELGEIVGTVTPDDLLGSIFSEFCIGK